MMIQNLVYWKFTRREGQGSERNNRPWADLG